MSLTKCFFCDRHVQRVEMDHFPIPARHDGDSTVPACLNCHDLKDRTPMKGWNVSDLYMAFVDIWENLGPEGRVLIAKLLSLHSDILDEREVERAA